MGDARVVDRKQLMINLIGMIVLVALCLGAVLLAFGLSAMS